MKKLNDKNVHNVIGGNKMLKGPASRLEVILYVTFFNLVVAFMRGFLMAVGL
jgi:hypothetical protein